VEEFVQRMKKIQAEADAALHKAQDDMKHYADHMCADAPKYKPGDKVWLNTEDLPIGQPSRKLTETNWFLFNHQSLVELKLPTSFKIHPVISVSHLWPYKPSEGLKFQPYENLTLCTGLTISCLEVME
jgi:hypothetical protein